MKPSPRKVPLHERPAEERIQDFAEVNDGYSLEQAVAEATRCIQCPNQPCVAGCPVRIDIPGFIRQLRAQKLGQSLQTVKTANMLPAICGRVCPQENQCEQACTVGKIPGSEPVGIGRLERFVADIARQSGEAVPVSAPPSHTKKEQRVAIIGSGPAGLTCAAECARAGLRPTIFEALHEPGGVLTYGIPEFRLPKQIVRYEIENVRALGVEIRTDVLVGRTITLPELQQQYAAIFIGIGAGTPVFMNVPGTNLKGVFSASEVLTRVNLMRAYDFPRSDTPVFHGRNAIVVGGGNVAMDAARSVLRLGAQSVRVVYRRTLEQLPARREEYHHAVQEGITFSWLAVPVAYLGDPKGNLERAQIQRMELGEPDESGRRRPVPIPGDRFVQECDMVVEAIGQSANKVLFETFPGLARNKRGYLQVDPQTLSTSVSGIFAGGDIVTGAATVIEAMGAGKRAAVSIADFLAT